MNIDVFQRDSLMFPVIERDELSLRLQPENAKENQEFDTMHHFLRIRNTKLKCKEQHNDRLLMEV